MFDSRQLLRILRINITLLVIACILQSVVAKHHDDDDGEPTTPRDKSWLTGITMANLPDLPVRPVGSGECPNVDCDKIDDDSCFESCGNKATEFDIYGCPEPHQWSLTFDDGPSNFTSKLLDHLDKANIKATFCVMGSNVEKYPEIVKRAFDSGHQIASHTYSHPHLMSLTNEEIIYEVRATEKAIEKVIGVKPTYLRPPYGEADQRVKALLKEMGYKVLLWNVDPTDYDVYMLPNAPKKILGSFKMAVGGKDTGLNAHEDPGFISLQHDLYEESIDQIPSIIKLLKTKGYSFSTSAACHNDNNPHAPPTPPEAASDEANPAQDVSESEKVLKKNSFEGYLNTDDAKDNQSSNAENPLVKENEQKKEATSSSSKTINSPQTYVLLSLVFVLFSVIV